MKYVVVDFWENRLSVELVGTFYYVEKEILLAMLYTQEIFGYSADGDGPGYRHCLRLQYKDLKTGGIYSQVYSSGYNTLEETDKKFLFKIDDNDEVVVNNRKVNWEAFSKLDSKNNQ